MLSRRSQSHAGARQRRLPHYRHLRRTGVRDDCAHIHHEAVLAPCALRVKAPFVLPLRARLYNTRSLRVVTTGRGTLAYPAAARCGCWSGRCIAPPDDTLGNGGLDDGDYTDDVRLRAPTRWPEREAIRVLPHGAQHTVRTADAAQAA